MWGTWTWRMRRQSTWLDCTLPGTAEFDYVFMVCLLLDYFLKRLIWWIDNLKTIKGVWRISPHLSYVT